MQPLLAVVIGTFLLLRVGKPNSNTQLYATASVKQKSKQLTKPVKPAKAPGTGQWISLP